MQPNGYGQVQVTNWPARWPHSCRVKMFSKSNHLVIWCYLLPQFVVVCWFIVPNVLNKFLYIFCTECLKCFAGLRIEPTFTVDITPRL